jgi:hypothetical protein
MRWSNGERGFAAIGESPSRLQAQLLAAGYLANELLLYFLRRMNAVETVRPLTISSAGNQVMKGAADLRAEPVVSGQSQCCQEKDV